MNNFDTEYNEKLKELFENYDDVEVQTYLDNNFDLEDIESLLDDVIYYSDIPEFLTNKKETDYNTIKEWMEVVDQFDEYIAESAYNLDIAPDNVAESYQGKWKNGGDFAENLINYCCYLDSANLPSFITNHIDYQAIWDCELQYDYIEDNGYYFLNL